MVPTDIFSNTIDRKRIFILNSGYEMSPGSEPARGSISVIDTTKDTVLETIPIGVGPHYIYNDFFNENFCT